MTILLQFKNIQYGMNFFLDCFLNSMTFHDHMIPFYISQLNITLKTICKTSLTLRQPHVFHSWLNNLDRIILQIKVDLAIADPVRFFPFFVHCFLEEGVKTEDLTIKRHPCRQVRSFTAWKNRIFCLDLLTQEWFAPNAWLVMTN